MSPIRPRIPLNAVLSALVLCVSPLLSQAASGAADTDFMQKAAMGGMAEVAAGKLAMDKASNADVKTFATHMVDDHSKANEELKQLASSKSVMLPPGPSEKQKSDAQAMEKMSGTAFDRKYMTMMVADHKSTVALFEKESKSGKDADAKAWATKTLPTLREHLKMAQDTQKTAMSAH